MNPIRRIPVNKLEVGMYISEQTPGVADEQMRAKGFIKRPETLEKLKSKGLPEFYIDISKGKDSAFALPIATRDDTLKGKVPLKEERGKAEKVYKEARNLVGSLLKDVKLGNPIDIRPVEALADDINNSVLNNPNALLCLSAIREKDQYLLEHSINVGILMGILTRFLGYEHDTVHQLVTGALLHDIGKIRVPHHILNKPGKLTEEEWIEMKRHVVYGQSVLQNSVGITNIAMSICGQHHERLDGSGYPIGLSDKDIDNYGRLAAIVDVYDAITAHRVYHQGKPPAEAMKFLVELGDNHLDKHLVHEFMRCMGVYPVGTVVELDNRKVGVVISLNPRKPNQPVVRTFFNLRHKHYDKANVIDLSSPLIEEAIVGTLNPRDLGININDFL